MRQKKKKNDNVGVGADSFVETTRSKWDSEIPIKMEMGERKKCVGGGKNTGLAWHFAPCSIAKPLWNEVDCKLTDTYDTHAID